MSNLKPQKIFTSEAPTLDFFKAGTPKKNILEPVEVQLEKLNARDRLKATVKRKIVQLDVNGLRKEARKIQKAARNYIERKRGRPSTTLNFAPVEPEITFAPTPPVTVARARKSGVQQSDKMLTRSKTAQSEAQPRKIYPSDIGEYRSGQRTRESDKINKKERPSVEVLNPENQFNKGYFGDALNQLYQVHGVQPRQVKKGRPKSSVL